MLIALGRSFCSSVHLELKLNLVIFHHLDFRCFDAARAEITKLKNKLHKMPRFWIPACIKIGKIVGIYPAVHQSKDG